MESSIQKFWDILFKRDIVKKEELLREAIRVVKTKEQAEFQEIVFKDTEKEALFQFMKDSTEDKKLGYFPGDRDLFSELYFLGKDIKIIDFVLETYKNDYSGTIVSPSYLTKHLENFIQKDAVDSILINEAEKFLAGLEMLVHESSNKSITLTTSNYLMYEMLKVAFGTYENINVYHASLYLPLELETRFDLIISIPVFGGKIRDVKSFMSNETSAIAMENQLRCLTNEGVLIEIVPASFTFSSNLLSVRNWVTNNFSIQSIISLPEGTFRPYTGIKTYFLTIKNSIKSTTTTEIGKFKLSNGKLVIDELKTIKTEDLEMYEDWRIELMMAENKSEIKKFRESDVPKVKLKDVAEVFRGKSIMKNDLKPGDISVLNISNIEDGEVLSDTMETIDEEERKIKRYELLDNDLVMTCRGTVTKVAVYMEVKNRIVIASANIIVIRFKEGVVSDYVKIFLESPTGVELIKTFQRGTTVMNINPKDISELEIPLVDYEKQLEIVNNYQSEKKLYQDSVREATNRWNDKKNGIYNSLL